MKLGITTNGPTLDDEISDLFTQSSHLHLIDTETKACETLECPGMGTMRGSVVHSPGHMKEYKIEAVLTGTIAPQNYKRYKAAGVDLISNVRGPARPALEAFLNGTLQHRTMHDIAEKMKG
jgi:predicted Fe-Mo cluster-binding NifX family protein